VTGRRLLVAAAVLAATTLLAATAVGEQSVSRDRAELTAALPSADHPSSRPTSRPTSAGRLAVAERVPARLERKQLPGGGTRIFGHDRFLVAYYGAAEPGAIGVVGTTSPALMRHHAQRAARPFRGVFPRVQPVHELIVTVADRRPGRDGDYSHHIAADQVRRYVRAAHRHRALLLLDVQPGRAGFLTAARHWAWALRDPWVGLALDSEWRVGPRQRPAGVIGSVGAPEVNRTARWLARLVRRQHLPEKLFVLHQFTPSMIRDIGRIRSRPGLAMVQHADGVGTRAEKMYSLHAIARPGQFTMGIKVFYLVDTHRFRPADVRRIRPRIRFVSLQ
jgi:hypothetical protein